MLVIVWVGIPVLLVAVPALRWIADRHRAMAGRVARHPVARRRTATDGRSDCVGSAAGWAADPMTWRDLAWALVDRPSGFAALAARRRARCSCVVASVLWWFGARADHAGAMPRWTGRSCRYGHTEQLEQRVQVLTETRAEPVDHSAAELRRIERDLHDGAQARLVALWMNLGMADELFEPTTRRRPGGWSPRPGPRPAPPWATCASSSAASTRRCSPTAGWPARSQALALDMADPGRRSTPTWPAARRRRSSRRPTSRSPSAWPTSASTPAPSTPGSQLAHADGVLTAVVGDDGRGGADPAPAPACAG